MLIHLLCLMVLCISGNATSLQCKDETGQPVDWFYVYKLPRQRNHVNPLIRRGVAHAHITPAKLTSNWVMSEMSIGDPNSIVGRTLAPLYQDANLIQVIYNDQPPVAENFVIYAKDHVKVYRNNTFHSGMNNLTKSDAFGGHTKGVVLADDTTALWLVHSVPHFPPVPDVSTNTTYAYPNTGAKFGQTFLCLSLQSKSVDRIGLQLKYNEPLIVHISIPKAVIAELPNLVDVAHNRTVAASPWYHTASFQTLSGREFLSFAKSASYHDDLYSGMVSNQLRSDLLTETWINGPGVLQSECAYKFQVHNIESIKHGAARMSFSSHDDHSKWAVAVPRNSPNHARTGLRDDEKWICVGDINRAISQESRGGGTVCTSEPTLWDSFRSLVDSVQQCV